MNDQEITLVLYALSGLVQLVRGGAPFRCQPGSIIVGRTSGLKSVMHKREVGELTFRIVTRPPGGGGGTTQESLGVPLILYLHPSCFLKKTCLMFCSLHAMY